MLLISLLSPLLLSSLAAPAAARAVDHSDLDAILRKHVRDERVDYLALRKEDGARLKAYLDLMAEQDVSELSRDEQIAYYVNVYNASMLQAVIDRFREDYTPADEDFRVFQDLLVRLKGRTISLNDLEHGILRPEFQEPRIHVALVCAARSCPPLLPRAYLAADLDGVLQRNMERFVLDSFRNELNEKDKTLSPSRIFEWFAEDFGGKANVVTYVDRFHPGSLASYRLGEFLEYSWALNVVAPRSGRWVTVTEESDLHPAPGGARNGRAGRLEVFEVLEQQGEWLRLAAPDGSSVWIQQARVRPLRLPEG